MKKHEERTSRFWQDFVSQYRDLSPADYEEWRTNPVTRRLFDHLEYSLLGQQRDLGQMTPGDPYIPVQQAAVNAYMTAVEEIFSWVPEGIVLESDYED